MKLVKILKALGDETRLRILNVLKNTELCVCEIQYSLEITQSNTSRHLKTLSDAGLVVSSKKAQWVSYKINDAIFAEYPFVREIFNGEMDKLEFKEKDLEKLSECLEKGIPCEWPEKRMKGSE